jgi:hypothetical protein
MLCFAAHGVLILQARDLQPSSTCPALRRPAVTCKAGFGAPRGGEAASPPGGSGRSAPKKKQRTIRATYLELVESGATEFVCFVRAQGSGDGGWRRVGTVVAENDDCCVCVTTNKRIVLEHAKRLHPKLGMVKVLEVGVGKDDSGATPPLLCERAEGTVTGAFSPDAVSTGSFYASRMGDGRPSPIDTSSFKRSSSGFKPRKTGEGKTPGD